MIASYCHREETRPSRTSSLLWQSLQRLLQALVAPLLLGGLNHTLAKPSFKVTSVADILKKRGQQTNIVGSKATAAALAQKLSGPGLTIKSANFITGGAEQFGNFSGGLDSIGIAEGIVVSSGSVGNVKGPNKRDDSTISFNGPGYSPLEAFVPAGTDLFDAAVLEITFQCADTKASSDLKFNYVFGSEEYPEYVFESYNDVFAFFLNGKNKSNNVALLPDGTAVAIDTINCGKNNDGINQKNCDLYVNNARPTSKYDTEMDGFTKPLQVKAHNLTNGDNVITIAIADSGDTQFDSWVFIQSASLTCLKEGAPTPAPTKAPTKAPGGAPITAPTTSPTKAPNKGPTNLPTKVPTKSPTKVPTMMLTENPTMPIRKPTSEPTSEATSEPTSEPTRKPTRKPKSKPTRRPTKSTSRPNVKPNPFAKKDNVLYKCYQKVRRKCDCQVFCLSQRNDKCAKTVIDTQCPGLARKLPTKESHITAKTRIIKWYKKFCICSGGSNGGAGTGKGNTGASMGGGGKGGKSKGGVGKGGKSMSGDAKKRHVPTVAPTTKILVKMMG